MTHTPGPWTAKYFDAQAHTVFVPGAAICAVYNPPGDDSREANARLIAAAPDLLAALEWAAKKIDDASGSPTFTAAEHDSMLAVIAKAKE